MKNREEKDEIGSINKFDKVRLADQNGQPLGLYDKMKAHEEGLYHFAFSIFIFDSSDRLLLQKRASSKYHSGGLWTNTCCSHQVKEDAASEAKSRLKMEMGFTCELTPAFTFSYKARFSNGITENEIDTVFVGRYDGKAYPDPAEVEDSRYVTMRELMKDVKENPDKYTFWFRESIERVAEYLMKGDF
jgi:isopentenyl-diphosphate delta-isomerase